MRSLLIVSAAATLLACTATPTAEVTRVRLLSQGSDGGRVVADLKLANKADLPMPIQRLHWVLKVEGAPAYELETDGDATVPMGGTTELQLPAGIRAADLAGRRYLLRGEVVFKPDSIGQRLMRELGVPPPDRWFRAAGVLEAPPAEPVSPGK